LPTTVISDKVGNFTVTDRQAGLVQRDQFYRPKQKGVKPNVTKNRRNRSLLNQDDSESFPLQIPLAPEASPSPCSSCPTRSTASGRKSNRSNFPISSLKTVDL